MSETPSGNSKWVDLRGTETILLVENEEALLAVFERFLTNLGYTVLMARNGEEGLKIFSGNPSKIDVAVLDVAMPLMSGDEALKKMRELKPELIAVLSSGLPYSRNMAGDLDTTFLAKPYSITTLAQTIRKMLGQR
jgi:two-component system cell cycle sensor histidine kinase/response regulator CckA